MVKESEKTEGVPPSPCQESPSLSFESVVGTIARLYEKILEGDPEILTGKVPPDSCLERFVLDSEQFTLEDEPTPLGSTEKTWSDIALQEAAKLADIEGGRYRLEVLRITQVIQMGSVLATVIPDQLFNMIGAYLPGNISETLETTVSKQEATSTFLMFFLGNYWQTISQDMPVTTRQMKAVRKKLENFFPENLTFEKLITAIGDGTLDEALPEERTLAVKRWALAKTFAYLLKNEGIDDDGRLILATKAMQVKHPEIAEDLCYFRSQMVHGRKQEDASWEGDEYLCAVTERAFEDHPPLNKAFLQMIFRGTVRAYAEVLGAEGHSVLKSQNIGLVLQRTEQRFENTPDIENIVFYLLHNKEEREALLQKRFPFSL